MSRGPTSLSTTVVEAVADVKRVDPVDLPEPLADTIVPDALDVVFRNGTGRATFDYCGYEVTVDAKGAVDVTPLKEA